MTSLFVTLKELPPVPREDVGGVPVSLPPASFPRALVPSWPS
jgi:hypothetical protein